jgi:tape measure domain-containing protein
MKNIVYNISFEVASDKAQKDVKKLNYELQELNKHTSNSTSEYNKLSKATDLITNSITKQTNAIQTNSRAESDAIKVYQSSVSTKAATFRTNEPIVGSDRGNLRTFGSMGKVDKTIDKTIDKTVNAVSSDDSYRVMDDVLERIRKKFEAERKNVVKDQPISDTVNQIKQINTVKQSVGPTNPFTSSGTAFKGAPIKSTPESTEVPKSNPFKDSKMNYTNIPKSGAPFEVNALRAVVDELTRLNKQISVLVNALVNLTKAQSVTTSHLAKAPQAFNKVADAAERMAEKIGTSAKKSFSTQFINLGYYATAFYRIRSLLADLSQAFSVPLSLTIEKENFETSLTTLMGSSLKAKKKTDELIQFAAKTPLEMTDIQPATNTLLSFGVEAEKLIPTMQMLGDLSRGNSANFKGLALIFGQAKATGRIMGQDLNQLANRGVPILQELAKHYGKTVAEIRKMGKEGKLTFNVMEDSLVRMTSSGGQFDGMMDKMSKTTGGQLSTIRDQIKILLVDGFEHILPVVHAVMQGIVSLIQGLYAFGYTLRHLPNTINENKLAFTLLIVSLATFNSGLILNTALQIRNRVVMLASAAAQNLNAIATRNAALATNRLTAALAANPYGLILVALTALIAVFPTLIEYFDDTTAQINRLKDIMDEVNDTTEKEQLLVRGLFDELADLNTSYERRVEIVKELNELYGSYLPYMIQEVSVLGEMELMYNRVTNAIRATALEKRKAAALEEFEKVRLEQRSDIVAEGRAKGLSDREVRKKLREFDKKSDIMKLDEDVRSIDSQRGILDRDISNIKDIIENIKKARPEKDTNIPVLKDRIKSFTDQEQALVKKGITNLTKDDERLLQEIRLKRSDSQKELTETEKAYTEASKNAKIEQSYARIRQLERERQNLDSKEESGKKVLDQIDNKDIILFSKDDNVGIFSESMLNVGAFFGSERAKQDLKDDELKEATEAYGQAMRDLNTLQDVVNIPEPKKPVIQPIVPIEAGKAKKEKKEKEIFYDEKHLKIEPFAAELEPIQQYTIEMDKVYKIHEKIAKEVYDPINPLKLNIDEMKKQTDAMLEELKKRESAAVFDLSKKRENELKKLDDQIFKAQQDLEDAIKSGDEDKIRKLRHELAPVLDTKNQEDMRKQIEQNFSGQTLLITQTNAKAVQEVEDASYQMRISSLTKFMKEQEDLYKEGVISIVEFQDQFLQGFATADFANFDLKERALYNKLEALEVRLNSSKETLDKQLEDTLKLQAEAKKSYEETAKRAGEMEINNPKLDAERIKIQQKNAPIVDEYVRYNEAMRNRTAYAKEELAKIEAELETYNNVRVPKALEEPTKDAASVSNIPAIDDLIKSKIGSLKNNDNIISDESIIIDSQKRLDSYNQANHSLVLKAEASIKETQTRSMETLTKEREIILKHTQLSESEQGRMQELKDAADTVVAELENFDKQNGGTPEEREAELNRLNTALKTKAAEIKASQLQEAKQRQELLIISLKKNEAEFQTNLDFIAIQSERMQKDKLEYFKKQSRVIRIAEAESFRTWSIARDIKYQMGSFAKTFEGRRLQAKIDELKKELENVQHESQMVETHIAAIQAQISKLESQGGLSDGEKTLLDQLRIHLAILQAKYEALAKREGEISKPKPSPGTGLGSKGETGSGGLEQAGAEATDLGSEDETGSGELEQAEAEANEAAGTHGKNKLIAVLNGIKELSSATIKVISDVIQAEVAIIDKALTAQQEKVDRARERANESKAAGDAEMLQLEQERLDKLNKQKEGYIEQQRALAIVEMIINTAVLVTKAALEGGGIGSAVTIAIALASLAGGLIAARMMATQGFEKGGFTGNGLYKKPGDSTKVAGVVHENEFVFNREITSKNRDIFERIHSGNLDLRKQLYGSKPTRLDIVKSTSVLDSLLANKFSLTKEVLNLANQPITVNVLNQAENNDKMLEDVISKLSDLQRTVQNQERMLVNIDERGFSMRVNEVIKSRENIRNRTK